MWRKQIIFRGLPHRLMQAVKNRLFAFIVAYSTWNYDSTIVDH